MKDNLFLIMFCVFFIVLDTLVLGYSIGRIYPPIPKQVSVQPIVSSARKEKQEQKSEEQEEVSEDVEESQEQQDLKQKSDITEQIMQEEQQITTITEQEAIRIVELDYQADGHIVVMSEDDKSYTIGCFWEMYFDEETGEPLYNMQAAEYVINKYNGQALIFTQEKKSMLCSLWTG